MKWNAARITIARPVSTVMVTLIVVVLGISAIMGIPRDLMPDIELPVAMVITNYANASPQEVETLVTAPIEQALSSIENLDQIASYTMEGMSVVGITFQMGTDMNFASLHMREKIGLIKGYLPEGVTEPLVMKLDMNTMPVMQVYVSSDLPLEELTVRVEDQVVPHFERSGGVASVSTSGGVVEEIAIQFSQESLLGYGLTLSMVSQILAAENINLPSGDVSKGQTEVIVRTLGKFQSLDDLINMPLTVADRSILRLGDVATVSRQMKDMDGITRIDGQTAIGIMISKQSDANTVRVSRGLSKELAALRKAYPEFNFTVGYDEAEYINGSISSVANSALTGSLLAILAVFLFLRNLRSTLVIAISIPTSLLATFAAMQMRGITLNLVTLTALALAVGMLVDNSIVVLENIFRLRSSQRSAMEAADEGTGEVFLAVLASTLTTVTVFLPIAFAEGMASLMFAEFCFTMIIALLASLLVSLTVVPMLCSKLLTGNISTSYLRLGRRRYVYRLVPRFADFLEELTQGYDRFIRKALTRRKQVIVVTLVVFLVSSLLLGFVGWELLPATDEGRISISVETPYGTSLAVKDAYMAEIEDYVLTLPELSHVSLSTQSLSVMSLSQDASLTVNLLPRNQRSRSSQEVAADIKAQLADLAGVKVSIDADSSVLSMMGTTDMTLMVLGKDHDTLVGISEQLLDRIANLPLVASVTSDLQEGNPEIRVLINRNAAAHYGITAWQLADALSSSLGGTRSTDVTVDGKDIQVNLSLRDAYGSSIENMKQIVVVGSYGIPVSVGQIASFQYNNAPSVIVRYNQQNGITLNIDTQGRDLERASAAVEKVVAAYAFPEGYHYEMSGLADEMMKAFGSLGKALIVSTALVFLLLAAQFESPLMALIVMASVPFAMSGAFLAMFITGSALSMTSFLGLIMLVGIVVNNSILLVEFIRQNEGELGKTEALVLAGKLRMRPILMTTITTIFGMIPLSLGIGEGGEVMAPLGISIIGGLTASTAITLILIPVIYNLLDERKTRRQAKAEERRGAIKALEEAWAREDAKGEEMPQS